MVHLWYNDGQYLEPQLKQRTTAIFEFIMQEKRFLRKSRNIGYLPLGAVAELNVHIAQYKLRSVPPQNAAVAGYSEALR